MVMGSLPEQVDLAVIGGGVGGYVAAIRASQLGLNVAIVEKNKLGGHCLNYACIPSKTLIHIADIFYDSQHSQKFGINVQGASIDAKVLLKWRTDVSTKLENGVDSLLKLNQVEIVKGTATFLNSNTLQLTNGTSLDFKKALIATGSEPTTIPEFAFGGNVIDYKQALSLAFIPKTMAIVGAGYVAVEIGTLFAKFGTKVTIIARTDVLSKFDRDAVQLVKSRMEELGVKIYVNATPASHDAASITLATGEKIDSEIIVVAIGLKPYTEGLGLENTKVKLDDKGFITVDEKMLTTDQNIFAVGDVVGEPMLAHKAIRQGTVAGESAAGQNSAYDNVVVPAVIFSDPEIAIAGKIEGDGLNVTKFPLSALGRAIALDSTRGFVKIASSENGIVKGIEIVSAEASSMISEAALAIEMGATLEDIADTIHPHPTYSEAVQEAAKAALGRPLHFFYPKKKE
ncbi:MAG TPA: dihydrolipoyl dehydrogenase [Candidatus Aquilonibacter sp.]|nr:dihydrolipoyl dehydrogenase [Candidatus Aquilonibacter sp.]